MKSLRLIMLLSMFLFMPFANAEEYDWRAIPRQITKWSKKCLESNDASACEQLGIMEKNTYRQERQQRGYQYQKGVIDDTRRREWQQRYSDNYYRSLGRAEQARIQGNYPSMYESYQNANQYRQWMNESDRKPKPWYKFWN